MDRLAVALPLLAAAALAARLLARRRPAPPTQARYRIPAQLDRADFADPGKPWLVVVFSSETCASCAEVRPKVAVLESAEVGVDDVAFPERRDLHERYGVDVVPLTLVVGPDGAVRASFVGNASATDLWAAVAGAREAGAG